MDEITAKELSVVVIGIFVVLEGVLLYEWYALKYRKAPTITKLVQTVPLPLRVAGVVAVNLGFLAWQLFHFEVL